ncbi:MAG: ABC transporter ATP-binding protein, partial [Pseudonocardiaceae bacterium]
MSVEVRSDRPHRHRKAGGPTAVLEGVTVGFPRRTAPCLRVDSLRLGQGEQVLVVGPSGAGKSTLLQTLNGVVPLSVHAAMSGRVEVCGAPTAESTVAELSRHVAVVAQDPSAGVCLPRVDQELALVLENRAVAPDQITDRIEQALSRVGAGHLRHRATRELSGGEVQRVALAAALVAAPDLLLVDEPTSMLDQAGVQMVRDALAGVMEHQCPTVVMVEHRLDEIAGRNGLEALPSRVVVLDDQGRVVADGPTTQTLYAFAQPLLTAGCWLPVEVELAAWTGAEGGLSAPANRQQLLRLARQPAAARRPGNRGGGADPVLRTRGLSVARGDVTAPVLTDVELDLYPGEIVALLGANGVGKSTLLLTLAGLLCPQHGRVDGARAGMVFQNAEHQFVAHTVADEVGYGLSPDAKSVVTDQLHRHRLTHLAGHSPYRLSGGEKRRLSLAAMLAHDRAVLLLDEPTLGLDRTDTTATTATLRAAAAAGTAVLFASHDLRTVATLADRVVLLDQNGVVADGPTRQVLADDELLRRARLALPPLLRWLAENVDEDDEATVILRALD